MAYKLIWSPAARDDLHNIVVSITRDNPNRADALRLRIDFRDKSLDKRNWTAQSAVQEMLSALI